MQLTNITSKYGHKIILNNLSLHIENEHQIIGLLGPNGAGKTTLLNIILKKLNTFKGTRDIPETIAYMPDRNFLYESMSVKSAIKLFESSYSDFDTNKAENMLKEFNIDLNMKLHSASKGMHEQIHLSLILSRNVDFYILDEPLGAVDPIHREFLITALQKYRNPNSSLIVVTHLVKDLEDILDRVLLLNNGQIIQDIDTRQLKNTQQTVEDFYKKELIK